MQIVANNGKYPQLLRYAKNFRGQNRLKIWLISKRARDVLSVQPQKQLGSPTWTQGAPLVSQLNAYLL